MDELNSLFKELRQEDWWQRQQIVRRIADAPEALYLDILEKWLRNGEDALERTAAMEVYRALGPRATPALTALLFADDMDVRIFAANILGETRDPQAVGALSQALSDREPNVRIAAVEALGKTGDRRAIENIGRLLNDDPWAVMAAIEALGNIGGDEARLLLEGLLEQGQYRGMVCAALEKAGTSLTIPRLLTYTGSGEIGVMAVKAVIGIAEREGAAIPAAQLAEYVPVFLQLSGSADAAAQRAAVVALVWAEDIRSLPVFIRMLSDRDLQEQAIEGLVALGAAAAPGIIAALNEAGSDRRILANILSLIGERQVFVRLADDPDQEVRTEAALALGDVGSAEAEAALRRLAEDAAEEVRDAATLSLRRRERLP